MYSTFLYKLLNYLHFLIFGESARLIKFRKDMAEIDAHYDKTMEEIEKFKTRP